MYFEPIIVFVENVIFDEISPEKRTLYLWENGDTTSPEAKQKSLNRERLN